MKVSTSLLAVVALLSLAALAVAQPPDETGEGRVGDVGSLYVDVRGQSGKIALGDRRARKQKLVINFDSLSELAADGSTVGRQGKSQADKHSFNSFASKDFAFTALRQSAYQGVPCVTFNFSATFFGGDASLDVMVYLFKKNGTIVVNDEESDVTRGMLKFNTVMKNWPFCTAGGTGHASCSGNEVGAFLDFGVIISSKSRPTRRNATAGMRPRGPCKKKGGMCRKPLKFDLGDGSDMGLSTTLAKDGVWEDMATGFPTVTAVGNKQVIKFRFPRFNSDVLYDPTLNLGVAADDDDDNAAGVASPMAFVTLLAMAVACLLTWA